MKLIGILLLLCSTCGALAQLSEELESYKREVSDSLTPADKLSNRFLAVTCDHGTLSQNQCICDANYFDASCSTNATPLTLNNAAYPSLSSEKQYFYIDLSSSDKGLTLNLQYLPSLVTVALGLANPTSYLLPSLTNVPDSSSGNAAWGISLPSPSGQLTRLFILVDIPPEGQSSKTFTIKVTNEETSHTLTIVLIVVGTLSIILNIVGCVYFVKYRMRREIQAALRQRMERADFAARTFQNNSDLHRHRLELDTEASEAALTQEDLNLYFPEKEFEKIESAFGQTDCPICLEEFKGDVTCRQLYCDHIFHTKCIQFWLAKQKACPTCKKSMSRKAIGEYYLTHKKKEEHNGAETDEHQPLGPNEEHPIEINIEQQPEPNEEHPIEINEEQPLESNEEHKSEQNEKEPLPLEPNELEYNTIEVGQRESETVENQIVPNKPTEENQELNV